MVLKVMDVRDIDVEKLDKLALTNSQAKQMQLDHMKNNIRRCGNFFSFVTEVKVNMYAERLQQKGINASQIALASDKIIDSYEKFPPFRIIVEMCQTFGSQTHVECSRCYSGGLLCLYERSTGRSYAFSCECENGRNYPKFTCVNNINLNKYTRHSPLKLGVDNPYEGWKETNAMNLKKIYRAKEIKDVIKDSQEK